MNKRKTGKDYELLAVEYLKGYHCEILALNYFTKYGEIDIIFWDKDTLVFCEVKYRASEDFGNALESITKTKKDRIIISANSYIQRQGIDTPVNIRFDAISLTKALNPIPYNYDNSYGEIIYNKYNEPIMALWVKNAFMAGI